MKQIIITILSIILLIPLTIAQKRSVNIALFSRKGAKNIFQKTNIEEPKGALNFSDFMTLEEYNALKPDNYFYVLSMNGTPKKVGILNKYTKEEKFFNVKSSYKKTPFIFKHNGTNFNKHKAYLEIDGEKTLLKDGMTVKLAKIRIKRRKLIIKGAIPYERKASLWIDKKEFPLDDRLYLDDSDSFNMTIYKEDGYYESISHLITKNDGQKTEIYSNDQSNIFIKNKTENTPLFLVDGVPLKQGKVLSEISPDTISAIQILKGTAAKTIYGEKGKNGVIIISTKKRKNKE